MTAMENMFRQKASGYSGRNMPDDYIFREVMQEILLEALTHTDFYDKAAFFGGTALRLCYGLPRFSEDLDFTVVRDKTTAGSTFDLSEYKTVIERAFRKAGLNDAEYTSKKGLTSGGVANADIRCSSTPLDKILEHESAQSIRTQKKIRIKIDVETDAPRGCGLTAYKLLNPVPCDIRVCDLPSLFAGKMAAILCRRWQKRVKGRDWYDLLWYVQNGAIINAKWLEARLRAAKDETVLAEDGLSHTTFLRLYLERVDTLDIEKAKKDVEPFIDDDYRNSVLPKWSRELFATLADRIRWMEDR